MVQWKLKWAQLRLLLWKNFLLRRRQPLVLITEIVWPLVLSLIIVGIRTTRKGGWDAQAREWPSALPSAGYVPWVQTLLCRSDYLWNDTLDSSGFPNLTHTPATTLTNVVQILANSDLNYSQLLDLPTVIGQFSSLLGTLNNITSGNSDTASNVALLQAVLQQQLNLSPDDAAALATAQVNWNELVRFALSNSNTTQAALKVPLQLCDQLPALSGTCRTLVTANPILALSAANLYGKSSIKFYQDLLTGQVDPSTIPSLLGANNLTPDSLRLVFCNTSQFGQVFTFPADQASHKTAIQRSLCNLAAGSFPQGETINELMAAASLYQESLFQLNGTDLRPLVDFAQYALPKLQNCSLTNITSATPGNDTCQVSKLGMSFTCGTDLPRYASFNGYQDNVAAISRLPAILQANREVFLALLPGNSTMQPTSTMPVNVVSPSQGSVRTEDEEEDESTLDQTVNSGAANAERAATGGLFNTVTQRLLSGALKILYAPNNTVGNQIIDKMLEPLKELNDLVVALNSSIISFTDGVLAQVPALNRSLGLPAVTNFLNTTCNSTQFSNAGTMQLCRYAVYGRQLFQQPLDVGRGVASNLTDGLPDVTIPEVETMARVVDFLVNSMLNQSESAENYIRGIFLGLPSEYDLEVLADNEVEHDIVALAGLIFTNLNDTYTSVSQVPHIQYKIRQNETFVPSTRYLTSYVWRPGPCSYWCTRYRIGGFIFLQDMVDRAIQELQTNIPQLDLGVWTQEFPYPCYLNDRFASAIASILPLMMVLGWVLSVAMLIKNIVYERENRLKEVMKVMGLDNSTHWVAWFINSLLSMAISATILTMILKGGDVLKYSNSIILWLYLMTFCISTIMFCFLVSIFFSRANLAACCGAIIYFACYLPSVIVFIRIDSTTFFEKVLACLLSPSALGLSTQYIAYHETEASGLQWDNLSDGQDIHDGFSFSLSVWFMVIDSVIYGILVWYLDNVMPGQYGIPRKWNFPFTASYWLGPKRVATPSIHRPARRTEDDCENLVDGMDLDRGSPVSEDGGSVPAEVSTMLTSEEEPSHLKCGVSFHHLVKSYDSSTGVTNLAVDDLCVNFYEGQITSFLGHNGAGKTTTMSVLTGMFPPTSGTAYVYGRDIRTEIDSIRRDMGMCPQHNVLFDRMTVEEHLKFYAEVKGVSSSEVKRNMNEWIAEVGLVSKRKCLAKNLSGGMKRKLSVAIAFVGNSSTVILDEPTAGVDPYSRRAIWDMLVRYRNKGRTIILSTHHMDEADILGDRIAIISNGKLRCVGSSLFLKSQYGEGYTLTMAKKTGDSDSTASRDSVSPQPPTAGAMDDEGVGSMASTTTSPEKVQDAASACPRGTGVCQAPVVLGVVKSFLDEASLVENIGAELMFNLPAAGAQDGRFTKLFTYLDDHLHELGIASYGVSDTTLEEVFLKVSDDGSNNIDLADNDGFFAATRRRLRGRSSAASKKSSRIDVDDGMDRVSIESNNATQGLLINDTEVNVDDDLDAEDEIDGHIKPADLTAGGSGSYQVVGAWKVVQQFRALFVKRFHHSRKNRKGFVAQVIVPAIFVALAMLIKLLARKSGNLPSLLLVPSTYPQEKLTPIKNYDTTSPSATRILGSLKRPCGVSTEIFHVNDAVNFTACFDYPAYGVSNHYMPSYRNTSLNFTVKHLPEGFDQDSKNLPVDCYRAEQCAAYKNWCKEPLPNTVKEIVTIGDVTLQDLGETDLDTWITDTTLYFHRRRWGAISTGGKFLSAADAKPSTYRFLNRLAKRKAARAWINTNGYHSYPIYVNVLNNAILRGSLNDTVDPTAFGVSVYNQPFNKTSLQLTQDYLKSGVDILISVCIIFAMSFVPASFVLFLIKERTTSAKHLQRLAGVSGFVYWFASYVWDMCNYLITVVVCIFIFLAFNIDVYTSPVSFPAVIVLFLFYGWSITPLMYPATFFFNVPSTAYVFLVSVNIFVGVFGTLATFILQLFPDDDELTQVNNILRVVFLVFPNYCLGRGLMDIAYQYYLETLSASLGAGFIPFKRPWGFDVDQIGRNLVAMAVSGLVFFLITLMLESSFLSAVYRNITGIKKAALSVFADDEDAIDSDVAREKRRVKSGRASDDTIVLNDFTKVYGTRWENYCAVRKLNLGVPKGECFGLLGVNGAGKTSTFKMLTGEESVSAGDAFLNGLSVVTDRLVVQQQMGYCPQFDALDDLLSGREHLTMYARLRGVPEKECGKVVDWAMDKLSLTRYANKSAGSYSGGNKRKLSTAMALIGKPPVIFLDEPTTGMDPKARRFLWTIVSGLVRCGHCIILTSHSMEECEALCQRLAIMVNGTFKCLGSPQHLRNKFGDGYTVTVRLTGTQPDLSPVKEFFDQTFPGARIQREHHNMVVYQLPNTFLSLSRIFHAFEEVRQHLPIEDYSVSQTTLDQVFIGFASKQAGEEGDMGDVNESISSGRSSAHVVHNPIEPNPVVHFNVNGEVHFDMETDSVSV